MEFSDQAIELILTGLAQQAAAFLMMRGQLVKRLPISPKKEVVLSVLDLDAGQESPPKERPDEGARPRAGRKRGRCAADIVIFLGQSDAPAAWTDIIEGLAEQHHENTVRVNLNSLAENGIIKKRQDGLYELPSD